ncbi:hypothetical protein CHS0354_016557 [Potamilus streckersoni]|uniref:Novel STAND NTPase 3 domain-containing protein n=1 Tax=Potamilus streckersoni TaxID=2493646 RepID=A0AAE0TKJ0_9BIVA|nr:hypothetical protein CHS0354_016557 [Potamilus streckersoni]
MAAFVSSVMVKDEKYSNWLKVNLALSYLKNGIHSFVESEVKSMHENLLRTIYGNKIVQKCTTCNSSDIRCTGKNWEFSHGCNLDCGKWLQELQKLFSRHINLDQILWTNTLVQEWPFNPWECAKIFLPRGQSKSNTGPRESDSNALMTLLASCEHFRNKLSPQGFSLTYKISEIRSSVMQTEAMEVSDADKKICIQHIINFLQDPVFKSLEECKTAIAKVKKIDKSSLELDLETAALNAVINDIRLELGKEIKKNKDTIDCLKEEYKQLRELLIKELDDFEKELKLHCTKQDAFESNIKQHERKRNELDTVVPLHEERLGVVEKEVEIIYKRSEELKTNTVIALQQQDQKYQDMDTTVTQLSESVQTMSSNIASCKERIIVCDDKVQSIATKLQNGTSESIPSKRQESDDLKDLKNQTEDSLDTFRKMGFIPTTQTEEAKKLLQENRSIVIKGKTGEGKTSTALHLINTEDYINQRVVIRSPKEWKKVDTDWVKIVVLEDIFGQYHLDPGLLQEWINTYLQTIQNHVDVKKLQVIITIRDDILLKAYSKLKSFKLFSSEMSLTLSSEKLKHSDKMSILNSELKRHVKDMNIDEKEECIFNHFLAGSLIGFPQCCTLFAKFKDLFEQGPKFFESPEKGFVENITHLQNNSFMSLAFLFCSGEIEEEYLSLPKIIESMKYLPVLEELVSYLGIPFTESTVISLRQSYEHFSGLYVDKVYSYDSHYRMKSCIQFFHATVCEAVGQVLGDRCPEMVVKYGDSGYLYQKTYTAEAKDDTSQKVFIPVSVYGLLVKRMIDDVVKKHLLESVVNHSAFRQYRYVMTLKSELQKGNRTVDFFMHSKDYALMLSLLYANHKELSEGICMTFLQYMLRIDIKDKDVVKLVYREFLEFLECTHNNNSSDCWQCKEKQNLLELALYYHHFEIADQLITMNACYTNVSLCNAARHGDLSRVQAILEYLKRSQVFDPECTEVKKGLCRAYISGTQDIIKILLQEGIRLEGKHVVYVTQHGDINALVNVVEHLKCHKKWNPQEEKYYKGTIFFHPDLHSDMYLDGLDLARLNQIPCSIALYITYCNGKFDMADFLVKNEVKVSLDLLNYVSLYGSQQAVEKLIKHLKDIGSLDSDCDNASEALENAYKKQNYKMCNLLIQEGVSLTMKNLSGIVMGINLSLKPLKKAMKHLKDINSWDPKCNDACEALEKAYSRQHYGVCDLLVQEGLSLAMKHLSYMTYRPLDYVKTAVKQLKDADKWDPKCDDACETLEKAYRQQKYEICDLLVQEGVPITMKHVRYVIMRSLDDVKIALKHLKDTGNWDPNCDDAFEVLQTAYREQKYDAYHLLIQEGVLLTLKSATDTFSVRKVIQQLKSIDSWDPKGDDGSYALENMYRKHKYDACDLLVLEGVPLTMKHFRYVILRSLDDVKIAVKQLKDTNSWDPMCDDASAAFNIAYTNDNHDVCDLLVQEGYSLTMKNLYCAIQTPQASLESIKKVLQQLKDAENWDPNCGNAPEALGKAYGIQRYDVSDMLMQEGVSLTMKSLTSALSTYKASLDAVITIIQKLKATNSWDPKCAEAKNVLLKAQEVAAASLWTKHLDVCVLLCQMMTGEK